VGVIFQPETGRPAGGLTDAEGHYTVNYTITTEGALVGKSKVYIEPVPANELEEGMPRPPRIPRMYLTPFEEVEVQSGDNEFNFELVSEPAPSDTSERTPRTP
jgi:hypothetical protein